MNLSQLYYFKKLAELQHYTKAAQALMITQPSLSGAIHSLEEELGVELFRKKGRNIVLTKNGKEFYTYVSAALFELDKGIDIMQERAGRLSGEIAVGCVNSLLSGYLPSVVKEFRDMVGTNVHVSAHMEQTDRILENVMSGKWDIGFCSFHENYPDLEFIPILSERLVVAAPLDHPLSDRDSVRLDELASFPLLSYHSDMPIGRDVQKLLSGKHLAVEFNYSTEEAIIGAMRVHDSAAILLRTPFVINTPDIKLIQLPEVNSDFHLVYMVHNRKIQKLYAVESFLNFMQENHSFDRHRNDSAALV